MESLLEDELSLDNTLAHIDAMASELDEAGERNTERWGVPEFEGEVEALRTGSGHGTAGCSIASRGSLHRRPPDVCRVRGAVLAALVLGCTGQEPTPSLPGGGSGSVGTECG